MILRLLAGEYMKFLAVKIGLSGFTEHGDEHDAAGTQATLVRRLLQRLEHGAG